MILTDIIKELSKIQKEIPHFLDTKVEIDHKVYKLYYNIYGVIKLCIRGYFLDDEVINNLQVEYYSLFVNIYNLDIELFQMCTDHNSALIKNLITILENYEYYEAASNVTKLIKNIE